jgi:hypothetical protein
MHMQSQLMPEEQTLLIRAAVMAGISVAVSKWSGDSGTSSEFSIIPRALLDAIRDYPSNAILQSLASNAGKQELEALTTQFSANPTKMQPQDVKPFALRRCDELAELLASKVTPQEAEQVKQAIIAMCRRVAEESKEDAFFGLGGQRISPEEVGVINEVARALKTSA